ncbi:MAG: MBL fold metallo-hydrolase [Nanoarchaeota archaeon]|nr:MBL fold metallo-hydrolase [Nanoarchaeota archaeon]MBU1269910.1 MBL fold metallo-hydrolase [Nanoarchaeota archaeon]MBU1604151.1 MBL fold metallo-hydrolase [Nanoarchaeota archaeon]MBU2443451.1 MBL fold metallo-hydrolase [Nanoarchaeota archaeon]
MNSSITFLGTGGDSIVVGKQLRASGGIIFKFGESVFLIDPGPGALVRMKQFDVNVREITAILVSHNHLNHSSDVNSVISAMTYSGIDKRGILVCDEETLHGSETEKPVISNYHKGLVERFITMKPGMKIGVNDVNIVATNAKHTQTSIGFKFYTEKFIVSYTSDTEYCKELVEDHADSDVIIVNCKNPLGLSEKGHMNTEDVVKFLEKTKPKLAILTHFGIKMLDGDPIFEAREIQKKTPSQVIAARDGMTVNPTSYASSINQKRLDSF